MSNKNTVISTSILKALPVETQDRNFVLRQLERKAVKLGLCTLFFGFAFLAVLDLTSDTVEERGQQVAEDLFKKTNGTICTGKQEFLNIDSSITAAFSERIIELCKKPN